ncbi:MAG: hypothetical protein ACFE9M_11930, partial [Promethearchaeota archaeon]
PTEPTKGKRNIRCIAKNNKMNILISLFDAKKFKEDQVVRLKDLMNIRINSIDLKNKIVFASFQSKELNREFSIIQWVPKDENIKVSILKPDGTTSKGNGEINLLNIPMNQTIQFERYGFCNPIKIKESHLYCYFAH